MVMNFLNGGAAINVLAAQAGARISVIDMGVVADLPNHPDLVDRKIAKGTADLASGPAMSRAEALESVLAGSRQAMLEVEAGVDLLVAGDMGIGNSTSATAIISGISGAPAAGMTGPGTGLNEADVRRKAALIEDSMRRLRPDPEDPLDVLSKVGGFEIGGIAGLCLGAAARRTAIVVDGVISAAGALLAATMAPSCVEYMFAGHRSVEPAQAIALERLGLKPILDLEMRLGEGTGAVLASMVLEAACRICSRMATFEEAQVSKRHS